MVFFGFVLAFMLFCHFKKQLRRARREALRDHGYARADDWSASWRKQCADWNHQWAEQAERYGDKHAEWHRKWAKRMERHAERDQRRHERRSHRAAGSPSEEPRSEDEQILARARARAAAEMGFYGHLTAYLGVITLLALINLMTTWYPWFLWPAIGWGFGLGSHWMGVFGSRALKARYFDPAVERELQREKAAMQTEKQASLDELSSTIAHEIRHPIADPHSHRGREEPGAADGRGSAFGRERRVRQGGARRARPGGAPDRAPPQVRQGGGLRDGARQPRERGRLGAHPAARQARRRQGGARAQLHHGAHDRRRRREAEAGVRERARQRHRRLRRRAREPPHRALHRERREQRGVARGRQRVRNPARQARTHRRAVLPP